MTLGLAYDGTEQKLRQHSVKVCVDTSTAQTDTSDYTVLRKYTLLNDNGCSLIQDLMACIEQSNMDASTQTLLNSALADLESVAIKATVDHSALEMGRLLTNSFNERTNKIKKTKPAKISSSKLANKPYIDSIQTVSLNTGPIEDNEEDNKPDKEDSKLDIINSKLEIKSSTLHSHDDIIQIIPPLADRRSFMDTAETKAAPQEDSSIWSKLNKHITSAKEAGTYFIQHVLNTPGNRIIVGGVVLCLAPNLLGGLIVLLLCNIYQIHNIQ